MTRADESACIAHMGGNARLFQQPTTVVTKLLAQELPVLRVDLDGIDVRGAESQRA